MQPAYTPYNVKPYEVKVYEPPVQVPQQQNYQLPSSSSSSQVKREETPPYEFIFEEHIDEVSDTEPARGYEDFIVEEVVFERKRSNNPIKVEVKPEVEIWLKYFCE